MHESFSIIPGASNLKKKYYCHEKLQYMCFAVSVQSWVQVTMYLNTLLESQVLVLDLPLMH